jgi:GNAT superfamily N-acetyltransferase
MNIRRALPHEAPLIQELVLELALFEKAPQSAQASLADISRAFFLQGFAIWFLNFSTWTGTHGIYLEDLFIRPEARGRGYGKAFLRHLASLCVARGYHRLQWWVLDWNQPAINFYQGLGAHLMDEWTTMRVDGEALYRLSALS